MKIGVIVASMALSLLVLPASAAEWTHNGVTVVCPWAEATDNHIAPIYMEIRASSEGGQRLTSAFSELAESAEIDSYTRVAGVLRRQRIQYLPVEAGQAVQLLPGGYHVLLVGLKEPLEAGTSFEAWLEFEPAGGLTVEVDVVPPGAGPPCDRGTETGQPQRVAPGPSGPPPVRVLPVPPPIWIPRGSY